nr:ATP-binding cassette domain-containing protein [Rhodococcus sp. HNM0569]
MSRSTVLQGVSLSARRSELVALVGPSGSGKTTLARAVTGLAPLSHGRITLDGRALPRLSRRPRATLADVQYVCQEVRASFEPDRPVVDQVLRTAVQLRGLSTAAARTEARAILRRLDIDGEQASRLPDALSGGQLRRVALARASIARPRVLLCDEVTTGLERPLAELILDEIDVLRREIGTAVVLIGHDLRALTGRADRLIVLGRGEVTDDLETGDWAHGSPGLHRLLAADGLSFEPAPSGEPAAVHSRS